MAWWGSTRSATTTNVKRDEIISDLTWYEQHPRFCQVSDLMICVGLSCGTLAEIAWTKWIKKPEVWVLSHTLTLVPRVGKQRGGLNTRRNNW